PGLDGAAAAAQRGVPGVLDALGALELDGDDPVVRPADREVHVEPVRPSLAGADVDGATTATATAAATAAGGGAGGRGCVVVAIPVDGDAEVVAIAVRRGCDQAAATA